MKRVKRFLCVLLTLSMVLGMIPATVFAAGSMPFTDVKESDWFYDSVQYVYDNGLMNGTGASTFSPNKTTTRGMIVTILHRMEGTPSAIGTDFPDVPAGQYYSNAVAWASANGIVGGYGSGNFGPNDPITREQMATILYRYAQYKGYDLSAKADISSFADSKKISSYAVDAVSWAVGMGLIQGYGGNTLSPTGGATRAQAAAILTRFCNPNTPETKITVSLHASQTEFSLNEKGKVYFYADVTGSVTSVMLVDKSTGKTVLELLDNGQFSSNGDDLPGDNVYSGIMTIDTSKEAAYNYYAIVNNDSALISETIQLSVVGGFTDEQLTAMENVDDTIQDDIFSTDGYADMSMEDRISLADEVLENLVEQDLIEEDTLLYDEDSNTYTFLYESGAIGAVILKDWETGFDGGDNLQSERATRESADYVATVTEDAVVGVSEGTPPQLGEAIVLWSFEQAWDDPTFRVPFYQQLESEFDIAGLDTTVDWDVTVNDYKNLDDYEVIMISGHGSYTEYTIKTGIFSYEKRTLPSLLLFEESTKNKDKTYDSDLKNFRVGKISVQGGTMYAILPNFFTHYYDDGDLSGSFVFIQDCESHGKDGNENFLFSSALLAASAEAVVGYHNSVLSVYGRNLMKTYISNLIDGNTAIESFNSAVSTHGATDGNIAYPLFRGDENAVLVATGIKNGDFEEASTAIHWDQVGDTRILTKLGSLTPPSKAQMAILTTGIGSAEENYLAGTEGSVLSQTFRIPENATRLAFSYDVVSEEPTEYIGSSYNDTFLVKLTVGSEAHVLVVEDINNSSWYKIDGIDFEGGDHTTYHTMWQSMNIDVSSFAGQIVTLEFIVYDVGDSIYDTAALIDCVTLN